MNLYATLIGFADKIKPSGVLCVHARKLFIFLCEPRCSNLITLFRAANSCPPINYLMAADQQLAMDWLHASSMTRDQNKQAVNKLSCSFCNVFPISSSTIGRQVCAENT